MYPPQQQKGYQRSIHPFLFECLLLNGCVPVDWRLAHITPIFKKGDPTLVSNYRPISLTSVCCKVMETVIKNHIMNYLLDRKFISRQQHGFLTKRSTCTQLLESIMTGQSHWIIQIMLILFMSTFLERLIRSFTLNYYVNLHHMEYVMISLGGFVLFY